MLAKHPEINMNTFNIRKPDGTLGEAVRFTPILFTVGSTVHKLGLHTDPAGNWLVSYPALGIKVCSVDNTYKGVPCSSRDVPLKLARELAKASLEVLIAMRGSDVFNEKVGQMFAIYGNPLKAQRKASHAA